MAYFCPVIRHCPALFWTLAAELANNTRFSSKVGDGTSKLRDQTSKVGHAA
jgi:hypothetical protein